MAKSISAGEKGCIEGGMQQERWINRTVTFPCPAKQQGGKENGQRPGGRMMQKMQDNEQDAGCQVRQAKPITPAFAPVGVEEVGLQETAKEDFFRKRLPGHEGDGWQQRQGLVWADRVRQAATSQQYQPVADIAPERTTASQTEAKQQSTPFMCEAVNSVFSCASVVIAPTGRWRAGPATADRMVPLDSGRSRPRPHCCHCRHHCWARYCCLTGPGH